MEKIYENISQLNRQLFEGNVEPSHIIAEGEKEKEKENEKEKEKEKERGFEIQSDILKEPSSDAKGSSYGED